MPKITTSPRQDTLRITSPSATKEGEREIGGRRVPDGEGERASSEGGSGCGSTWVSYGRARDVYSGHGAEIPFPQPHQTILAGPEAGARFSLQGTAEKTEDMRPRGQSGYLSRGHEAVLVGLQAENGALESHSRVG